MKIDSLNSSGAVAPSGPRAKPKPASESAAGQAAASADVTLSSASSAAGGEEPVNSARVQEIRQAIAEGRFQINAGAIADRLIESARELVQAQHKA
jgi:negative regulator of flagellin synthesis FlgM